MYMCGGFATTTVEGGFASLSLAFFWLLKTVLDVLMHCVEHYAFRLAARK
jgi:hypothetical protein